MAATLLRAIRRTCGPIMPRIAVVAVAAAFLLLATGYLLSFTEIRALLPFTSPKLAIFSGAAELWLLTSSCGYALYLLFRRLTQNIPFAPSRRRLLNAASGNILASPVLVV